MSKILLPILFISIGVGVFIVYDENYIEDRTDNQQLNVDQGQIEGDSLKQKSIPGMNKRPSNQILITAKTHLRSIQDSNVRPLQDKLAELSEVEKKQSIVNSDQPIPLWEKDLSDDFVEDTTIEHEERIKTNPEVLAKLQVGQVLEFFVPQLGESFQSEITSTSNQLGNVKVWKGNIHSEGQEKSNFIMTQGAVNTNVVLSTAEGVYTVYIDNKTGEGTVIDDREYTSRMSDIDDAVPYHHDQNLN